MIINIINITEGRATLTLAQQWQHSARKRPRTIVTNSTTDNIESTKQHSDSYATHSRNALIRLQ